MKLQNIEFDGKDCPKCNRYVPELVKHKGKVMCVKCKNEIIKSKLKK